MNDETLFDDGKMPNMRTSVHKDGTLLSLYYQISINRL